MLPNKQQLEALRAKYPAGTKLILHRMNDPYPVPPGTVGEVQYVDDGGNIHMVWQSDRTLSLIEGVDDFSKATEGCGCPVDTSAEGRSTDRSDS